jgi:hypothetical protein
VKDVNQFSKISKKFPGMTWSALKSPERMADLLKDDIKLAFKHVQIDGFVANRLTHDPPYQTPPWFSSIFPNENIEIFLENLKSFDDRYIVKWLRATGPIVALCLLHKDKFSEDEIKILKIFCKDIIFAFRKMYKNSTPDEFIDVSNFVNTEILYLYDKLNKKDPPPKPPPKPHGLWSRLMGRTMG